MRPPILLFCVIPELEVLPLERDGVIQEEVGSVFEDIWKSIPGEVLVEGAWDIGEQESKVVAQGRGEDGGQNGERMVGAGSDAGDSAISEDKHGSHGANVVLDLGCNNFLVELVLPKVASVSQPGCVEDADLRKRLRILSTLQNVGTYHYAVVARKLVKAGRVGLRLIS